MSNLSLFCLMVWLTGIARVSHDIAVWGHVGGLTNSKTGHHGHRR